MNDPAYNCMKAIVSIDHEALVAAMNKNKMKGGKQIKETQAENMDVEVEESCADISLQNQSQPVVTTVQEKNSDQPPGIVNVIH